MAKAKTSEIVVASSLVPTALLDGATDVQLFKTWLCPPPGEGFPYVGVRPLKRSGDVSSLFPGLPGQGGDEKRSKHVWACMAIHDVSAETGLFKRGSDVVSVKEGDVFFMFEATLLRDAFVRAAREAEGLLIGCPGLQSTKTRRGTFMVRQWVARRARGKFDFRADGGIAALPMPESDDVTYAAKTIDSDD